MEAGGVIRRDSWGPVVWLPPPAPTLPGPFSPSLHVAEDDRPAVPLPPEGLRVSLALTCSSTTSCSPARTGFVAHGLTVVEVTLEAKG